LKERASAIRVVARVTGSNENDCKEQGDRGEALENLRGSQAVPPETLDPGDDDCDTPDHRVKRLKRLPFAEPLRAQLVPFTLECILQKTSRHQLEERNSKKMMMKNV
jgi:hypothetical protein